MLQVLQHASQQSDGCCSDSAICCMPLHSQRKVHADGCVYRPPFDDALPFADLHCLGHSPCMLAHNYDKSCGCCLVHLLHPIRPCSFVPPAAAWPISIPWLLIQPPFRPYHVILRRTCKLIHNTLVAEDVLDQAVILVFSELLPVCCNHTATVLPTMLQHEEALVQLDIHGAVLLEDAYDTAHTRRFPARAKPQYRQSSKKTQVWLQPAPQRALLGQVLIKLPAVLHTLLTALSITHLLHNTMDTTCLPALLSWEVSMAICRLSTSISAGCAQLHQGQLTWPASMTDCRGVRFSRCNMSLQWYEKDQQLCKSFNQTVLGVHNKQRASSRCYAQTLCR